MTISLIVPAFNEAQSIENLFSLVSKFSEICSDRVELVVIENGSFDSTRDKLSRLSKQSHPFVTRILELDVNVGYGGALKKGLASSNSETVMILPADGKYRLEALIECHRKYVELGSPFFMAKGNRTSRNDPKTIRFLSLLYTLLSNILFRHSLKDVNGLPKVFNIRPVREHIELLPNNACFDAGLIALWKKKGGDFCEIPVHFEQQSLKSASWAGKRLRVSIAMFAELSRFAHRTLRKVS